MTRERLAQVDAAAATATAATAATPLVMLPAPLEGPCHGGPSCGVGGVLAAPGAASVRHWSWWSGYGGNLTRR